MRAPLSRVIAEVWLRKALRGSRNAMVLSGDLELKLKSLSIQRMRDSSVCPVPASLPPNPVLPTWKFSLPVLPWRCPPVWDASLWGSREMLRRHAAKLYQDQHCTIPHPGFLCCPCHSPPPTSPALKGLLNEMMRKKGLQGFISLDPLLINYWSDIQKHVSCTPHDGEEVTCATARHLGRVLVNANTYLLMQLSS